ncbi:MAG TPA: DUF1343 domain-containing protein [Ohtaekwangia sp.]|uniref:exo-beta-N-acetylmuramidase NamZ family protein n=1 Tax=Ohtaekwangia sp. TaxID=2066019 RepID=UPI002F944B10
MKVKIASTLFSLLAMALACKSPKTTSAPPVPEPPPVTQQQPAPAAKIDTRLVLGAEQLDILLSKLGTQRVALVVNQTSVIGKTHLADTLKSRGVNLVKIFGPEHGFRGAAADGEHVKDGVDTRTGLPVVSLYGKNYKATPAQLSDVDIVIFDIQDVGARFYTYISTMHYMMEACAENNKKMIILDRPNPNGYVDGPINQTPLKSFVAMHAIPIAHGLTVAELAKMINGEGWLANHVKCDIDIIPMKNWKHTDAYSLPVKPSPNLPNDQAIRLYPSICLFEGTVISLGRGTQIPFQVLGNPELKNMPFQFTPVSIPGMSVTPPLENKVCYGLDLRNVPVERRIDLKYLIQLYNAYPQKEKFFLPYFDILTGNTVLKQQIKDGLTEDEIRETWKADLDSYKLKREKYLLYP